MLNLMQRNPDLPTGGDTVGVCPEHKQEETIQSSLNIV